jgi:hypothetical protein
LIDKTENAQMNVKSDVYVECAMNMAEAAYIPRIMAVSAALLALCGHARKEIMGTAEKNCPQAASSKTPR